MKLPDHIIVVITALEISFLESLTIITHVKLLQRFIGHCLMWYSKNTIVTSCKES